MRGRGASVVGLVLLACGGTTRGSTGSTDPDDSPDASAHEGAGGSRSTELDSGSPPAPTTGGATGVAGANGAGGAAVPPPPAACPPGTEYWNATNAATSGSDLPPQCFIPCFDRLPPCAPGTACADVPGCMCPDASHCEACFARWMCVGGGFVGCDELYGYAEQAIDAAAQRACEVDSECTIGVVSTGCVTSCVALNENAADDFQKSVEYAESTWCSDYANRGCEPVQGDCPAAAPVCVNGWCQFPTPPSTPSATYSYAVVNAIDSGDFVMVSRMDAESRMCVGAEFFLTPGQGPAQFLGAVAYAAIGGCCPVDLHAAKLACDAAPAEACSVAVASSGSTTSDTGGLAYGSGPGATLDVDFSVYFQDRSQPLEFVAKGITASPCGSRD